MRLAVPVSGSTPKRDSHPFCLPTSAVFYRSDACRRRRRSDISWPRTRSHLDASLDVPFRSPSTTAGLIRHVNDLLASTVTDDRSGTCRRDGRRPACARECIDVLFEKRCWLRVVWILAGAEPFVRRHPEFMVDYHGASIRDHRETARDVGASVTEVDSRGLQPTSTNRTTSLRCCSTATARPRWLERRIRTDSDRTGRRRAFR